MFCASKSLCRVYIYSLKSRVEILLVVLVVVGNQRMLQYDKASVIISYLRL